MGETTQRTVIEIVSTHLGINPADIGANTHLTEELDANSLDCVAIVMDIEDEFNINIPDRDAEHLETVSDIVACVKAKGGRG